MKNNSIKHTIFNLSALLLIVVLLSPTLLKFSHLLENHEQENCKVSTTHIHEHELECSVCDYQISYFDYNLKSFNKNYIPFVPLVYAEYYTSKKHNSIKQTFSLRGPPVF